MTGESRTVKEGVARNIHSASGRGHAPILAMNCAFLPRNLFESERFGRERRAFTGAHRREIGPGELPAELRAEMQEAAGMRTMGVAGRSRNRSVPDEEAPEIGRLPPGRVDFEKLEAVLLRQSVERFPQLRNL